jgi:hypothetical protein
MSTTIYRSSVIVSNIGDTPILSGRIQGLSIYSVVFEPNADVTGDIQIKLGSTILYNSKNPKSGGMYGFNDAPNFTHGKENDTLVINLPTAVAVSVNIAWS